MDPQSQYLVQALQQMRQQAPQGQAAPMPSVQAMGQGMDQRKSWEQANPGQSYLGHNLQQAGQNLMGAPGRLMQAPGNAMAGLKQLAAHFGTGPR